MPELPEVETTLHGASPTLLHQPLTGVTIRVPKLRLPTPNAANIQGQTVINLERRAKYILAHLSNHTTLLLHLGMSGRLTINKPALEKNDHILLQTPKGTITFTDPRRFGLFLHLPTSQLASHPLLKNLGPEPLGATFTTSYLHQALQKKSTAIKPTLMDNHIVVGVGNIYASESLFRSHIHPQTRAHQLTKSHLNQLIKHIKQTLTDAIKAGGSSLKDFTHSNGQLGYFQSQFNVYGRENQPCHRCQTKIKKITQAQRATFFCPTCQKL
ncbi:MAG: bifunctional DNA-formamidopyrimidine glycosylase/DNA-(apurinic or apyrimidinic site) lyase [Proteobacteria bacterium]|nr:bifunctional DNA-formamidopyrimidine glycosylase/DNA-(apurinic or apyrimidinic site) lyase [Pseudomonadota bacterium]